MPSYGITIKLDTASPYLAALARGLEEQTYQEAVGEAGVRTLFDHLQDRNLDAKRHKTAQSLGATQSGLYADMARATSWDRTDEGVLLSIRHPAAAQRYFGGMIEPTGGRTYLTIPAIAEAYGVRARDAGVNLRFAFMFDERFQSMRPALARADDAPRVKGRKSNRRRGDTAGGTKEWDVWYWLVESVEQDPDTTLLPTDDEFGSAVTAVLMGWLEDITP